MHQTTLERIEQELKKIKRQLQCGTQFFDTVEEFPAVGVPCAIYVDKSTGAFYVYDTETATYITADAGEDVDFSLTTTGTSGPATLVGTILNIPQYQAALTFDNTPTNGSTNPVTSDGIFDALALKQNNVTLTTTGTSGAATFVGSTLNIPQYQGVLTNPVTGTGTAGQVAYFNGTSSVTGSANLFWDAANGRLGVGVNTSLTARLHVRGSGTTSATTALLVQNSTPSELFKVTDDGQTTLSPTANTSALVSSTYSVTGSGTTPLINLSGTWNTTGLPSLITSNITDTASHAFSNLMLFRINGIQVFRVTKDGGIYIGDQSVFNGGIRPLGLTLNIASGVSGSSVDNDFNFGSANGQRSYTSGTSSVLQIRSGASQAFQPTSGTGVLNIINIPTVINQTGGASGVTRGLYVNPTLTAAADWRGVEIATSTVNTVVLGKNTGSAAIEVTSTTQGVLFPRMTTTQRNAIVSPAAGLVIFNTTTTKLECYDGAAWQAAW